MYWDFLRKCKALDDRMIPKNGAPLDGQGLVAIEAEIRGLRDYADLLVPNGDAIDKLEAFVQSLLARVEALERDPPKKGLYSQVDLTLGLRSQQAYVNLMVRIRKMLTDG